MFVPVSSGLLVDASVSVPTATGVNRPAWVSTVASVPFGSAAHGMILKAMQDRNWPADCFRLVSQSPEVGSTNLQEKKIVGEDLKITERIS